MSQILVRPLLRLPVERNKLFYEAMFRLFYILLFFAYTSEKILACGLNWDLPHAYFPGVDEKGHVSYWEKIDEVDLGDGLKIPININFNSARENSSPALGKGWMLPILESHIEPINENCINVIMPSGWTFTFYRIGSTQTWKGNAGWVGEANNTIFTITAPCGWSIKFDQGRIIEMITDKNQILAYKYNGKTAVELSGTSSSIIKLEERSLANNGQMLVGNKKIGISLGQRPNVAKALNSNIITTLDSSLVELKASNIHIKYNFSVDKNLNPMLTITENNGLIKIANWDPETKQILSDDEWTYKLNVDSNNKDNVGVRRTNKAKFSEYFEKDIIPGVTIEKSLDNTEIWTYRFVGAGDLLNNKIRKIEKRKGDNLIVLRQFTYDQLGRIVRDMAYPNDVIEVSYDNNGKIIKLAQGKTDYWSANQNTK